MVLAVTKSVRAMNCGVLHRVVPYDFTIVIPMNDLDEGHGRRTTFLLLIVARRDGDGT